MLAGAFIAPLQHLFAFELLGELAFYFAHQLVRPLFAHAVAEAEEQFDPRNDLGIDHALEQ